MITLLVDDIINDAEGNHTQFVTPTFDLTVNGSLKIGWNVYNENLLHFYDMHPSFCVIPIKDFTNQLNPHYLINMRYWGDYLDQRLWDNIPKNTLDVLLSNHQIPILLWYPLEGPDNSSIDEWQQLIDMKNKTGLIKNKMFILSSSGLINFHTEKKINIKTLDNCLHDASFIPSTNYAVINDIATGRTNLPSLKLDSYTKNAYNPGYYNENEYKTCSISDHDCQAQQKKDFVCLNNYIENRINRLMLLQSLYLTDDLYKKNIISARWYPFFNDSENMSSDNIRRTIFFLDALKKLLIFHDIKVIPDDYVQRLTEILGRVCHAMESDNDSKLWEKWINTYLKKELLKILKEKTITHNVRFLCDLLIKSIEKDQCIFPKKVLEQDHELPRVYLSCGQPVRSPDGRPAGLFGPYCNNWYEAAWFSIITESWDFHGPRQFPDVMHTYFSVLSEKTIKAMINNHPFVVFSAPGATRLLNELGFKTFDQSLLGLPENFDEGVVSLTERTYIFVEALKKFSAKSHEEKVEIWNFIKPDVIYNSDRLRKTDWIQFQHDLILEYGQYDKTKN